MLRKLRSQSREPGSGPPAESAATAAATDTSQEQRADNEISPEAVGQALDTGVGPTTDQLHHDCGCGERHVLAHGTGTFCVESLTRGSRQRGGVGTHTVTSNHVFDESYIGLLAHLSREDFLWLSAKSLLPAQMCRERFAESFLSAQSVPRVIGPLPRAGRWSGTA